MCSSSRRKRLRAMIDGSLTQVRHALLAESRVNREEYADENSTFDCTRRNNRAGRSARQYRGRMGRQHDHRCCARAPSHVGAIGLTQVLPSTARLYEPGLTTQQLYDRDTNLRIGFRYLRDLLDRYPANMQLALLAYNRGPAKVEQLLGAGRDPANGYEAEVMKGFRHH